MNSDSETQNLNIYTGKMYQNPNESVIGVCSICGGDVVSFTGPWHGIQPPTPYCSSCGATRQQDRGPVIPMVPKWPRGRQRPWYDETWCMAPTEPLHLLIYKHEQENSGSFAVKEDIFPDDGPWQEA